MVVLRADGYRSAAVYVSELRVVSGLLRNCEIRMLVRYSPRVFANRAAAIHAAGHRLSELELSL